MKIETNITVTVSDHWLKNAYDYILDEYQDQLGGFDGQGDPAINIDSKVKGPEVMDLIIKAIKEHVQEAADLYDVYADELLENSKGFHANLKKLFAEEFAQAKVLEKAKNKQKAAEARAKLKNGKELRIAGGDATRAQAILAAAGIKLL